MVLTEAIAILRLQGANMLRTALSGDEQLDQSEMATQDDPGLFGPASSAWRVHSDSAMLIGGLRALMLQTLHPLAMAGVAQHSDYRNDPWGRLHRTGRFIGATTFGTTETAEKWISIVRRVHDRVQGTAPDGRPYSANDPHLLLWVHVTEVDSFLRAFERFGKGKLTDAEKDSYVNEMAEVAERLGADNVPRTRAELDETIEMFRAECEYTDITKDTVRFLLFPPVPLATAGAYGLISAGAVTLLPEWARTMLRLPVPPGADLLAIRPAATVLTRGLGWLLTAPEHMRLDDNMLSKSPKLN